jgi:hypothetical protein
MPATEHVHWPETFASRPTTWACWSGGEREAYFREQEGWDTFDAELEKVRKGLGWDRAEAIQAAAAAVRYAQLDGRLARLKRYRPDLSDLLDFAFDEDHDAHLIDFPGESGTGPKQAKSE